MTDQTSNDTNEAGVVAELAVNRKCRQGWHLWCPSTAGRFGKRDCGCSCHLVGLAPTTSHRRVT